MPFTTEQLDYAGKAAIDYFLKNDPVDQINTEHPWLKLLIAGKKEYAGGLQYVVEQLRFSNDSNFQSYFGDSQVTYNRKRTLQQAKYTYGAVHDGFGLNEDELVQNGIIVTDERNSVPTDAEKVQLTNLLEENTETLKLGFQEGLDLMLHRNGSASALDIPGLDLLIQTDPTTSSVVGGLNQQTYTWWRNNYATGVNGTTVALIDAMEVQWRNCTRYGNSQPDKILVGESFLDAYRKVAALVVNRQITGASGLEKGGVSVDASTSKCYFKGIELEWDPTFAVLDTLDAPAIAWAKRCYFINTKFIKLRPIKGHWMISRKPPRVYDRYVHYWAMTAKAALTTGKRNAHAVIAIS